MWLWPRPLIVAGIGVVSQGPEEGQTAVPMGGGGAWPDTEPPHPATHQAPLVWRAAAGPGRASRRRAEPHTSTPGTAGVEGAGGTGGHGRASRRGAERSEVA